MRALLVSVALVLLGCGERPQQPADDFGAAAIARAAVQAMDLCSKAGFDDVYSCADAPVTQTRRAALSVQEMERTYSRVCAQDLGAERCNAMLMSALASAAALQSAPTR